MNDNSISLLALVHCQRQLMRYDPENEHGISQDVFKPGVVTPRLRVVSSGAQAVASAKASLPRFQRHVLVCRVYRASVSVINVRLGCR